MRLKNNWHIGKKGPGPCHAKPGRCPLGGEHYPDYESAMNAYSDKLSKQYGVTSTVMKDHLEKSLKNKLYKSISNPSSKYTAYKTLRKLGKATIIGIGVTTLATATAYRLTNSLIKQKPLKLFRKNQAKKLLLTKYWR